MLKARQSIELQMIVKDGTATLPRCLASVAPLVDRVLIGDTGSVDGTCALVQSFGAEVISLPWAEDFAAARNQLLVQGKCDWILVLDADEMLDLEQSRATLPALLETPAIHAYGFWRWNYLDAGGLSATALQAQPNPGNLPAARNYPAFIPSYHVRLFRLHPEIRFQHCVHEDVTHSVDRLRLDRATAPLVLHHFGYVETTPEQRRHKVELYRELGQRRLQAAPNDFEGYLQLGISELRQCGQLGEAAAFLERAVRIRPEDSRASLYLGICKLRLNRLEQAKEALVRAKELGDCSGALFDALGDLWLMEGEYEHAVAAYRQAAAGMLEPSKVLAKCGLAEVYLGHTRDGMARIRAALSQSPASAPLQDLLQLAQAVVSMPILVKK